MSETKKVLWVDEQATVLLTDFRALVNESCVQSGIGPCFDFTLANNIEDGVDLASQPFDALILEIVLPRNGSDVIKLEDIRLRREAIADRLGRERLSNLLAGETPTISEENLLSRFFYLGRRRDEYWEIFGGFEILKQCRKDLPAIVLSTRSLKYDGGMEERFSLLGLSRSKWFKKPCRLEEVAKTLVDFFTETSPSF